MCYTSQVYIYYLTNNYVVCSEGTVHHHNPPTYNKKLPQGRERITMDRLIATKTKIVLTEDDYVLVCKILGVK